MAQLKIIARAMTLLLLYCNTIVPSTAEISQTYTSVPGTSASTKAADVAELPTTLWTAQVMGMYLSLTATVSRMMNTAKLR